MSIVNQLVFLFFCPHPFFLLVI
uniref:Uncharacterized protein n=1 Tax=Arundo donax TaxID=35708 RepID=A0A0A9EWS9_ARUDO